MNSARWLRWCSFGLVALVLLCCTAAPAPSQIQMIPEPKTDTTPRLEPVAETKLLMEGLAQPNFRGLQRRLKDRQAPDEAWTFARGQALLLAETANLLMLRPPRTPGAGQDTWMARATELRSAASRLARAAGRRDYDGSRVSLGDVAAACNRCHTSFRVPVRLKPFGDPDADKAARLDAER